MKKKITTLALVAALFAVTLAGATLAFFTDKDSKANVFTVGNVAITLTEPNWQGPTAVQPGVTYKKNPIVTNDGANNAWVRVNVTVTDAAAFKTAMTKHSITQLEGIFAGYDTAKWDRAAITEDTAKDTITYSYYYNTVLAPTATTGALFTSVTLPAQFDNADMTSLGAEFTITVTADAIQADTFDNAAGAFSAFDAQTP